eukprot:284817171_5
MIAQSVQHANVKAVHALREISQRSSSALEDYWRAMYLFVHGKRLSEDERRLLQRSAPPSRPQSSTKGRGRSSTSRRSSRTRSLYCSSRVSSTDSSTDSSLQHRALGQERYRHGWSGRRFMRGQVRTLHRLARNREWPTAAATPSAGPRMELVRVRRIDIPAAPLPITLLPSSPVTANLASSGASSGVALAEEMNLIPIFLPLCLFRSILGSNMTSGRLLPKVCSMATSRQSMHYARFRSGVPLPWKTTGAPCTCSFMANASPRTNAAFSNSAVHLLLDRSPALRAAAGHPPPGDPLGLATLHIVPSQRVVLFRNAPHSAGTCLAGSAAFYSSLFPCRAEGPSSFTGEYRWTRSPTVLPAGTNPFLQSQQKGPGLILPRSDLGAEDDAKGRPPPSNPRLCVLYQAL